MKEGKNPVYTSQTPEDVKVLEWVLWQSSMGRTILKVLEVGTFLGDTSNEIKKYCDRHEIALEFWGIDSGSHPDFHGQKPPLPFEGANMVIGDSAEVFHLVPDGFDVVLLDGCHCVNHVILDTIHYSRKVRSGGFLLFHDTSPEIQHTMKDPHGPDIPEFHNSVLLAIQMMRWPQQGWWLRQDRFQKGAPWGGMRAYQKSEPIA